jgi:hypothetical protein
MTDATRVIGGRDGGMFVAGEAVLDVAVPVPVPAVPVVLATVAAAEAVPPILPLESGRGATTVCCGCCFSRRAAVSQDVNWSVPGGMGDVGVEFDGPRRWWKRENIVVFEKGKGGDGMIKR